MEGTVAFTELDRVVFGLAVFSGLVGVIRGLKLEVAITLVYAAAFALLVITFAPFRHLLDPLWQSEAAGFSRQQPKTKYVRARRAAHPRRRTCPQCTG